MPDDLIGYEASSLTEVETLLDGLTNATSKQVYLGTLGVDARAIAAVAASRADAAGGGGASFPDEWTVGATGELTIAGADVANGTPILGVNGNADTQIFAAYKTGFSGSGVVNFPHVEGRVRFWSDFDADSDPVLDIVNNAFIVRDSSGNKRLEIQADGDIGFNGATPTSQPTGVAVTAAGIHAALVSLGLITA